MSVEKADSKRRIGRNMCKMTCGSALVKAVYTCSSGILDDRSPNRHPNINSITVYGTWSFFSTILTVAAKREHSYIKSSQHLIEFS